MFINSYALHNADLDPPPPKVCYVINVWPLCSKQYPLCSKFTKGGGEDSSVPTAVRSVDIKF